MNLLFTVLVAFFAGMGAGLGTGFAGMGAVRGHYGLQPLDLKIKIEEAAAK